MACFPSNPDYDSSDSALVGLKCSYTGNFNVWSTLYLSKAIKTSILVDSRTKVIPQVYFEKSNYDTLTPSLRAWMGPRSHHDYARNYAYHDPFRHLGQQGPY